MTMGVLSKRTWVLMVLLLKMQFTPGWPRFNVCDDPDCVKTAYKMIEKMNLSANPCDDFNEYACGRFIKEVAMPDGRAGTSTMLIIHEENQQIMKGILSAEIKQDDSQYLKNMKRLYKSCMNEDQIEVIGLTPYLNDPMVKMFPTLNTKYSSSKFNWTEVLPAYASKDIFGFYSIAVSTDIKVPLKNVIYVFEPDLGLSQEYYKEQRFAPIVKAYQKYLVGMAVELGAEKQVAEQDATDVINLEKALAQVMVPTSTEEAQYNPTSLGILDEMFPGLALAQTVKSLFLSAGVQLQDDEKVIVEFPIYLQNLSAVVNSFPARVAYNLFGFKYARAHVEGLTKRMRELQFDFDKVAKGPMPQTTLWETCFNLTSGTFSKGISKEFVAIRFSASAKTYMEKMIDNLKKELKDIIKESTWIGPQTKKEAYAKLDNMRREIGYPDTDFDVSDIEQMYREYNMTDDNLYDNVALLSTLSNNETLRELRKPVHKNEWLKPPHAIGAHYLHVDNAIAIPAGFLQAPIFSEKVPNSLNYGAIGAIIGHELTHGFDNTGLQYDAKGTRRDWWTPEDLANFVERNQCFVDQYSKFQFEEINMTVNGVNTQGENVADNGGLKESYRAFKNLSWIQKMKQKLLPGLDLTQDQLFFLAYAQVWCQKNTKEALAYIITSDSSHTPAKFRIIGVLQNSEDFAKAYNCPKGSYMNPTKKCAVW